MTLVSLLDIPARLPQREGVAILVIYGRYGLFIWVGYMCICTLSNRLAAMYLKLTTGC
jgi:hypothetical protein